MKYVTALLVLMLSASTLAAQPDSDAKRTLRSLLAGMESYQANFSQVVTDAEGERVHEASGELSLRRPAKLRWQTLSPDETLLIADGDAVWNIDHFVEQVTVISQQQAIVNNPVILLTSDDPTVWDDFSIENGQTEGEYTVTSDNPDGQIVALSLAFDGNVLTSLTMTDSQSQQSVLTFSEIKPNLPLQDGVFRPTFPDTYTVDDQR